MNSPLLQVDQAKRDEPTGIISRVFWVTAAITGSIVAVSFGWLGFGLPLSISAGLFFGFITGLACSVALKMDTTSMVQERRGPWWRLQPLRSNFGLVLCVVCGAVLTDRLWSTTPVPTNTLDRLIYWVDAAIGLGCFALVAWTLVRRAWIVWSGRR